ncbi:MAG: sensor histidine kinase [Christensenellales bacterium]
MNEVQKYLSDNFIFLMIIFSTYFIAQMKSSVDISIKRHMVVNMSLLLLISINSAYLDYLTTSNIHSLKFTLAGILYYSLKPLPMVAMITLVYKNSKYFYIPAILNAIICSVYLGLLSPSSELFKLMQAYHMPISSYVVTEWTYWIIFLSILNIKFYKETNNNPLGIFLFVSVLMTANILDTAGICPGILIKTYAFSFILYYLIIHIYISKQVNEGKDIKLREQRMSLMLSQIQPHFLYNTLNTITALCRVNPKLAEETTVKFSKFLRENMYSIENFDTHPFERELEHIKIYLEIEKIRFGDRLNIVYDIETVDFRVPVLTLQPIVENAVKHGICKNVEGGTITITTRKMGKIHVVTIKDDGVGFNPHEIKNDGRVHIGISNANERLKSIFHTEIEISSFPGIGTEVTIKIPEKTNKTNRKVAERREIHSFGR